MWLNQIFQLGYLKWHFSTAIGWMLTSPGMERNEVRTIATIQKIVPILIDRYIEKPELYWISELSKKWLAPNFFQYYFIIFERKMFWSKSLENVQDLECVSFSEGF